jgi:hypothetical protein
LYKGGTAFYALRLYRHLCQKITAGIFSFTGMFEDKRTLERLLKNKEKRIKFLYGEKK